MDINEKDDADKMETMDLLADVLRDVVKVC